ncbi:syntaxin-4-like isoform X1 [Synchiropus splendidus]|uniref:syntaxin-4-like isoform X1 n=1 Tax=Synchiropus splendidus TaxID=270530 RepID=UPI00237E0BD1|nr:syntaxin-4-like isoform X1 [Synchiropus splendidus]
MAKASDDGDEGNSLLITPEPSAAGETKENVAFLKKVQDAHETLQHLASIVSEVERKQNMILRAAPPEDSMKQELQTLRDEITLLASVLCWKLSSKSSKLGENATWFLDSFPCLLTGIEPRGGGDGAEHVPGNTEMQKMQHTVLLKESWELMGHLDTIQAEYRDGNMERIRQQLKIAGTNVSDQALDEMLKTDVFTENVLDVVKAKQEALKEVEFRHDEILKLEQSIKALHQVFPRLAVRVEDQEDGIHTSNRHWISFGEKAKGDLKETIGFHQRPHILISHSRKIWLALCLTILLLIVTIILVVTFT